MMEAGGRMARSSSKAPVPLRAESASERLSARRRELELLDDADLARRCIEGEELAWAALVQRFRRLVYAIPSRAGLRPDQTERVFHETFAKLAERIGSVRDLRRIRAWIVTTARRLTIDEMRARVSAPIGGEEGEQALDRIADPGELAPEELGRLETRHLVRQALLRLEDRCRRILTVLFYDDSDPPRSYSSIAKQLGMPVGSLGPTRARCLEKLAAVVEEIRGD
jgi:RNA polymerase sigma factor (sigma-70 family)